MVQHLLARARGGGDDHVHLGQVLVGARRQVHLGVWRFLQDGILQRQQLGGLGRHQVDLLGGPHQQPRAGRANGAGGAHHHGLEPDALLALGPRQQVHAQQRVVRRPQRTAGAVAVAGGDGQRRAARHRHAGVAHHLGEGAQTHDLRAQLLGHVGGGQ
ncbi:MAG: hypothetical protein MUF16_27820, partial [Burkholderiaceae bacterium]|nr:hypothetical protein [Burkholderiaceae bacterium]